MKPRGTVAIKSIKSDVEGYITVGNSFRDQKNNQAAIDAYTRGIALAKRHKLKELAKLYYLRSCCYRDFGQDQEYNHDRLLAKELDPNQSDFAQEYKEEAEKLKERFRQYCINQIETEQEKEEKPLASTEINKSADCIIASYEYCQIDQYDSALEKLNAALNICYSPVGTVLRACVQIKRDSHDLAEKDFEELVKLSPGQHLTEMYFGMAFILVKNKEYSEARKFFINGMYEEHTSGKLNLELAWIGEIRAQLMVCDTHVISDTFAPKEISTKGITVSTDYSSRGAEFYKLGNYEDAASEYTIAIWLLRKLASDNKALEKLYVSRRASFLQIGCLDEAINDNAELELLIRNSAQYQTEKVLKQMNGKLYMGEAVLMQVETNNLAFVEQIIISALTLEASLSFKLLCHAIQLLSLIYLGERQFKFEYDLESLNTEQDRRAYYEKCKEAGLSSIVNKLYVHLLMGMRGKPPLAKLAIHISQKRPILADLVEEKTTKSNVISQNSIAELCSYFATSIQNQVNIPVKKPSKETREVKEISDEVLHYLSQSASLALIAFNHDKHPAALEHISESINIYPAYSFLSLRGRIYIKLKKYDLAKADLIRVIQSTTLANKIEAYFSLALMYMGLGQYKDARNYMLKGMYDEYSISSKALMAPWKNDIYDAWSACEEKYHASADSVQIASLGMNYLSYDVYLEASIAFIEYDNLKEAAESLTVAIWLENKFPTYDEYKRIKLHEERRACYLRMGNLERANQDNKRIINLIAQSAVLENMQCDGQLHNTNSFITLVVLCAVKLTETQSFNYYCHALSLLQPIYPDVKEFKFEKEFAKLETKEGRDKFLSDNTDKKIRRDMSTKLRSKILEGVRDIKALKNIVIMLKKAEKEEKREAVKALLESKNDSHEPSKKKTDATLAKKALVHRFRLPPEVLEQIKAQKLAEKEVLRKFKLEQKQKEQALDALGTKALMQQIEEKKEGPVDKNKVKKKRKPKAYFQRVRPKAVAQPQDEKDIPEEDISSDEELMLGNVSIESETDNSDFVSDQSTPDPISSPSPELDSPDNDNGLPEVFVADEKEGAIIIPGGPMAPTDESNSNLLLITFPGNLSDYAKNIIDSINEREKFLHNRKATTTVRGGWIRNYLANQENVFTDLDIATDASTEAITSAPALLDGLTKQPKDFEKPFGQLFVFTYKDKPKIDVVRSKAMVETPGSEDDKIIADAYTSDLFANAGHLTVDNKIKLLPETSYDIQHKLFRTIGPYRKSFTYDPIRMLRIIYLSSNLGWRIPQSMKLAIVQKAFLLNNENLVRSVCDWLFKLLNNIHGFENISKLYELGIIKELFPALPADHHYGWIVNQYSLLNQKLTDFVRLLIIETAVIYGDRCKELALEELDLVVEENNLFKYVMDKYKEKHGADVCKQFLTNCLDDWFAYPDNQPKINTLHYLTLLMMTNLTTKIKAKDLSAAKEEFTNLTEANPSHKKIFDCYVKHHHPVNFVIFRDNALAKSLAQNISLSCSVKSAVKTGLMGSRKYNQNQKQQDLKQEAQNNYNFVKKIGQL